MTTKNNQQPKEQPKRKKSIKPYHRIKAHSNPLSDSNFEYPITPQDKDWSKHYPLVIKEHPERKVTIADIGCGYGGLTVNLSKVFPEKLILGMEIRDKVVQYVEERIEKLRSGILNQQQMADLQKQQKLEGKPVETIEMMEEESKKEKTAKSPYQNISVLKTNAMKYLPNFFEKGQMEKIFFLFPDPHFKKANHKRRIISKTLLAEYAYVLAPGGLAYFISDVEELYQWMFLHFNNHPLFQQITDQSILDNDPCIPLIINSSEEARKVNRIEGKKWYAVFRRLETPRLINNNNNNDSNTTTTTTAN